MRALLFAEGGPGVGLGHLRRCAALADGMKRRGWSCSFLAADSVVRGWLADAGQELADARPAAAGRIPDTGAACDVLIVDSYEVPNEEIARRARGFGAAVLVFDDRFDRHSAADIILNAGVLSPGLEWPGRPGLEHLLGPSYHPLPSEFLPAAGDREIRATVGKVLVTLGGAAPRDAYERVLAAVLRTYPGASVDCVVGPFSTELPAPGARVSVVRAPRSLGPLMRDCDLAVAASGQTLYELASTGTPTVAVGLAANQRENLLGMEKAGCILSAGALSDDGAAELLTRRLAEAADPGVRRRLSDAGRRLVDGRGAERVADALAALVRRKKGAAR